MLRRITSIEDRMALLEGRLADNREIRDVPVVDDRLRAQLMHIEDKLV